MRSSSVLLRSAAFVLLLAVASPALAHSFGQRYSLPVPLWLYAWGATAALLLSFVGVAWFGATTAPKPVAPAATSTGATGTASKHNPTLPSAFAKAGRALLQALGLAGLALTLATALFGSEDPYANFAMTAFWVAFVLVLPWLAAVAGDFYRALNPWRTLTAFAPGVFRGRLRYPARQFGHWPALLLYAGFVAVELFAGTDPRALGALLLGYTVLTLAGAWLFGADGWLEHGEFFSLLFALFARNAPVAPALPGSAHVLRLRPPCAGTLEPPLADAASLGVVLALLAFTAFDGLRETLPWVQLYAQQLAPSLPAPGTGGYAEAAMARLDGQRWFDAAGFLLLPLVYVAAYLATVALARRFGGVVGSASAPGLRTLALAFGSSLLPIALAYHLAHYLGLALAQLPQLPWLLADPFGTDTTWAWRWLGAPRSRVPDASFVWHAQVAVIVAAHGVSVVLAHRQALRLFGNARRATLSQLPMLLLMVAYTVSGLWILAQPIS